MPYIINQVIDTVYRKIIFMTLFKKIDTNNDHKISRDEFIEHMKLSKFIDSGLWDALFDALDVNKNGTLFYSEFWAKEAIKNSPDLKEALNRFNVSLRFSGIFYTVH